MTLLHLFFIFLYIGFFAIGGGLVAATFMQQTLVERYGLITAEKFYSMIAVSESTPGPIGINLATYVGTELYGPLGGIVATLGEVLPSLIVIIVIAKFFARFQEQPVVKSVFTVLRPVTSGLVLVALLQVLSISLFYDQLLKLQTLIGNINWKAVAFYAASIAVLFKTKLHPIVIVIAGGIFGVLVE